ncbi:hypothetical protein R6Q59_004937 [Mikania micrantha]
MVTKQRLIFPATLLLAISSFAAALPPKTITNAADTPSNSGYVAMSLTLNLVSGSFLSQTTSATIFTPPDSIFANSGQPPFSLSSDSTFPLAFLVIQSLFPSSRTKISTMSSDDHLTITSPSLSDQNYVVSLYPDSPAQIDSFDGCERLNRGDDQNISFHDASNALISRGYSVMASFLNLQLLRFLNQSGLSLTLFAPVDEMIVDYSRQIPDYLSLFLRHVLPCKISWKDLANLENRLDANTYLSGFRIGVTRSGGTLTVNGVLIALPDMYYSDWLVIHGIPETLSLPEPSEDYDDSDGDSSETVHSGNAAMEVTVPVDSTCTVFYPTDIQQAICI